MAHVSEGINNNNNCAMKPYYAVLRYIVILGL